MAKIDKLVNTIKVDGSSVHKELELKQMMLAAKKGKVFPPQIAKRMQEIELQLFGHTLPMRANE